MRIGIVSDIHCNVEGLRLALKRMGDVDELLCAGDLMYGFRFSNDVVEELRARGARTVQGNHERTMLSAAGDRARNQQFVKSENVDYIAALPRVIETEVSGKRLVMVHGSPFEPFDEYLYPKARTLRRFKDLDADYVILGHTHYPMVERVGNVLVINPGSAGEPADLSYAVLDTASGEVTFDAFARPPTSP
ncbi:MAG: YfcE family phosphodiesterase [Chloroflexi bacterium]|nr:YfcE family phosphodiesterase [Chloroflexota bacterium]